MRVVPRIPKGGVEALLHLLEQDQSVDPRHRAATSTGLVKAAGIGWLQWPTLRAWLLSRGLADLVGGPDRGGIVEQKFVLTEKGRETALDFHRGLRRVAEGPARPVPPPPPRRPRKAE